MNIMVFDVPASSGGALSILKDFYNEVKLNADKNTNWFFVISTPELMEAENIKVIRFPWIKKSWLHRLYFDFGVAPNLVRKYNIDKVITFQNTIIPRVAVPQILYVHQALPFVEYRFTFEENKLYWTYQNIIGKLIKESIKRAEKVIVQTEWMKKNCTEQTGIDSNKVKVIPPKINFDVKEYFQANDTSLKTFFFPAGAQTYKNHKIVIDACKKLKEQGINDYKVIFTLNGDENSYISTLHDETKRLELPIEFTGNLSREDVFELYTRSILLFPSYVETFGLPILEARLHRTIILAANCPFSREILEGYDKAYFFDPFNANELKTLMENQLKVKAECNTNFSDFCWS